MICEFVVKREINRGFSYLAQIRRLRGNLRPDLGNIYTASKLTTNNHIFIHIRDSRRKTCDFSSLC